MSYRVCLFLLCLSLPALAQQDGVVTGTGEPPQSLTTQSLQSTDRRVTVDVVVTDKAGKPVAGLQEQNFTVLDNKQPRKILSFKAEGADVKAEPLAEIIMVVDEVNASYQETAYGRDGMKRFLLQNGGKLAQPVSLIFFTDTGTKMQQGSSMDGNAVLASLNQVGTDTHTIRRSAGFYGAVERFQLSLQTLSALARHEEGTPGRKLVIWIGSGWPLLSGPNVDLSPKDQNGLFNSIVGVSTELRKARMTLYSVDPRGAENAGQFRQFYYKEFLKGVPAAKNVQSGNLALQVVATQSGGLVLNSSNDIEGEISRAAADATAYYIVSFDAPPAEHPNEYHGLEVKIDTPGLTARTRTGYYAQP